MQHPLALMAAEPGDDVAHGVVLDVPHVRAARRIGEHLEHVGGVGALARPAASPARGLATTNVFCSSQTFCHLVSIPSGSYFVVCPIAASTFARHASSFRLSRSRPHGERARRTPSGDYPSLVPARQIRRGLLASPGPLAEPARSHLGQPRRASGRAGRRATMAPQASRDAHDEESQVVVLGGVVDVPGQVRADDGTERERERGEPDDGPYIARTPKSGGMMAIRTGTAH